MRVVQVHKHHVVDERPVNKRPYRGLGTYTYCGLEIDAGSEDVTDVTIPLSAWCAVCLDKLAGRKQSRPKAPLPDGYVSVPEAAEMLGMTHNQLVGIIAKQVRNGDTYPSEKLPHGRRGLRRELVEVWIAYQENPVMMEYGEGGTFT